MISSTANLQVKQTAALQTKAKVRREQRKFVVEGLRLTAEAPPEQLGRLYVTDSFLGEHPEAVEGLDYETVTDQVFRAMSDTQNPQGILGIVRQREYSVEEMCRGKKAPLLLILENIRDPGNLGTMMRTAEAAGVDGVIMNRGTVDIYNPKVVRSTMGAIFRMPFACVDSLDGILEQCRQRGITICAAHLDGECPYDRGRYTAGTAFLIGNEGNGLTRPLAEQADMLVRIPMAGKAESLNAAVAAAILIYEAARQRGW